MTTKPLIKPARLMINRDALRHNIRTIKNKIGLNCQLMPTIKADAYGVGLAHILPTLLNEGVRDFFVVRPQEAYVLDAQLPKNEPCRIMVYDPSGVFTYTTHHQTIPVLNNLDDFNTCPTDHPIMIHIDTGMNRLGLMSDEVNALLNHPTLLKNRVIEGMMTHFVSSERRDDPMNSIQYERFMAHKKAFEQAGYTDLQWSLCNSGGVFNNNIYHLDFVRPGIALYGCAPIDNELNPLKPVITIDAPVVKIFTLKSGETIGYNGTFRAPHDMPVATLQIGYADGIYRSLSNGGILYFNGTPCPIIGRISMDLITVSLENCATHPRTGDRMDTGPDIAVVATLSNTIPYEIMTHLGDRFTVEIV